MKRVCLFPHAYFRSGYGLLMTLFLLCNPESSPKKAKLSKEEKKALKSEKKEKKKEKDAEKVCVSLSKPCVLFIHELALQGEKKKEKKEKKKEKRKSKVADDSDSD